LVRTVPGGGQLVVNHPEASLQRVLAQGHYSPVVGFGAGGQWQALGQPDAFAVMHHDQEVARVEWRLQGVHNQMNALAAMAAAHGVGVAPTVAADALQQFENVRRRMEVSGVVPGKNITVYDDFAHHPSAIATTLDGLRRQVGSNARILAVFEPRSNTMKLGAMKDRLADSLAQSDAVFCYSSGLDWDPAQPLATLAHKATVSAHLPELVEAITQIAQPGDHIVCMSNGGFGGIHAKLLAALAR
jgi:UDP-N-acetylmuramate: L-alanyl-gamma-D-glutamyl-meso-diaminopimelate ligase